MERYNTFITYYGTPFNGKQTAGNYLLTTDVPLNTFENIEKAMEHIKEELGFKSIVFLSMLPCEG